MKKIFFLALFLIMLVSVSAEVQWTIPTQINAQQNFEIYFTSNNIYGVEINLPINFIIISDPSNGIRDEDGVYRTTYGSNLILSIRAPIDANAYTITGKYTEGSGVFNFPSKQINVLNSQTLELRCPTCPSGTEWTDCVTGKQTRLVYNCDASTNYICVSEIQAKSCLSTTCEAGWICQDDTKLGLRKTDCTYSTVIDCSNGCDMTNNACKANTQGNLITGAVTGAGEGEGSMWLKQVWFGFIDWLKKLFSF